MAKDRQAAWTDLVEACALLGIPVTKHVTNETVAWRIGAHLLRTVHDLLTETQR